jgi:hypothetical protein
MGKKDSQGKTYAEKDIDERMQSGSPTFKDIGEGFVTKGKPYYQRGALDKAAGPSFRDIYDMATEGKKAPYNQKEPVPSDIADKLQDMKNQKGAEDYEKNKTYKKGGKTTAKCMARGGGIEIRGKTKGRFV